MKHNRTHLNSLRHCANAFLAFTLKKMFPEALFVKGTISDINFSYEIALDQKIDTEMLPYIEQELKTVLKSNPLLKPIQMMRENAASFFQHHHQPYLAEEAADSLLNIVDLLQIEETYILCPAPHITNPLELVHLKLQQAETILHDDGSHSVRITGTVFPDQSTLKQFLKRAEAAKKLDHRKLGQELNLFFQKEGQVYWTPKGAILRAELQRWLTEQQQKQPISQVFTPSDHSLDLNHARLFAHRQRSYRELPLRYSEQAQMQTPFPVDRHLGLFQLDSYHCNQVTLFCSINELIEQLTYSLHFIRETIRMFGFEARWLLKLKRPPLLGGVALSRWEMACQWLSKALEQCGVEYAVEDQEPALSGPLVEVILSDALGRGWCGPSLCVNMALEQEKGLELRYQGPDDRMHVPAVVTYSVFGSLERFIALLIERYEGFMPLWLAPEQVRVIPVKEHNIQGAERVRDSCRARGIRCDVDLHRETMGGKVHAAESEKVPYMAIVGDREEKNGEVMVRRSHGDEQGKPMALEQFLELIGQESASRMTNEEFRKLA